MNPRQQTFASVASWGVEAKGQSQLRRLLVTISPPNATWQLPILALYAAVTQFE